PVLQAADILMYRADRVPVGEDQRQHLELTRDIAGRFNQRFGETFILPQAAIPRVGAKILDLQMPDAKMSKSADSPLGTLKVTDPPEEIRRKVKVAVTDSGREVVASPDKPAITNLLTIYAVATGSSVPDMEAALSGKGYAELKGGLAEALVEFLRPLQDRRRELLADPGELARILRAGAEKAREVARTTLGDVYERVGFLPRSK
ncbi:MAG: tryptophan--tRNA ligase, partial [Actinobacteria bacterium]|nr:tryptophan--tRNA ligase [Actinomycetota bacterium]